MIQPDDPHRRRDEKKLQLHHLIAEHLQLDPERVLGIARTNLARWRERLGPQPYYAQWADILRTRTPSEIIALITADDDEGRRLRQATPCVGVVKPEERASIFGGMSRRSDSEPPPPHRAPSEE
jgi:hypothetical protein